MMSVGVGGFGAMPQAVLIIVYAEILWMPNSEISVPSMELQRLLDLHQEFYLRVKSELLGHSLSILALQCSQLNEFQTHPQRQNALMIIEKGQASLGTTREQVEALEGWDIISTVIRMPDNPSHDSAFLTRRNSFIDVARSLLRTYLSMEQLVSIIHAETLFWRLLPSVDTLICCCQYLADGNESASKAEDLLRTLDPANRRPTTRMTRATVRLLLKSCSEKTQQSMNDLLGDMGARDSDRTPVFAKIYSERFRTLVHHQKALDSHKQSKTPPLAITNVPLSASMKVADTYRDTPPKEKRVTVKNKAPRSLNKPEAVNEMVTRFRPYYQVCNASVSFLFWLTQPGQAEWINKVTVLPDTFPQPTSQPVPMGFQAIDGADVSVPAFDSYVRVYGISIHIFNKYLFSEQGI
jgi:hypothetical protein